MSLILAVALAGIIAVIAAGLIRPRWGRQGGQSTFDDDVMGARDASSLAVSAQRKREPGRIDNVAATTVAPYAPLDEDSRSVRVFVSSTFKDMQRERDVLVKETFPALRARLRTRGVELFEVDLRWGITEEQSQRGETLPTILAEIDRCRPYFIGLLGERYGWVPEPHALTDGLKAAYPSIASAAGKSVTEMEIIHGALASKEAAKNAIFFERDPVWLQTLDAGARADLAEASEQGRAKLADLKARVRASGARIIPYPGPDGIGPAVAAVLGAAIETRFPETDAPDSFAQDSRLHAAYARERRGLHIGSGPYLTQLDRWMNENGASPMLITGTSGGGKSALIANWLQSHRRMDPRDIVFEHYLGASPDSADPVLLMRRLWEQLNRTTGEALEAPSGSANLIEIADALQGRLIAANTIAERNGVIVLIALDGLDKLSSEPNLRWLPRVLPPRVKLMASSLDGETKSAALARGWTELEVKPLNEAEQREFVERTLAGWGRQLSGKHAEPILAHPLAGVPLFLKTVLAELRHAGTRVQLGERLERYLEARDMPDLFARMLERLEADCEPRLVATALPLIWASRSGLEEAEIIAIAGATPIAWATLRNSLGDALRDQAGRMAFGHDHLNKAVEKRYVPSDEAKQAAHLAIADRLDQRDADIRQAEELPFQLRAAGAWDRLQELLIDLDRFKLLRSRGDSELLSYWLPLKPRGCDIETRLCATFEARAGEVSRWTQTDVDLALAVTGFLEFAAAVGAARLNLQQSLTTASGRLFGLDHPCVATAFNNLAGLLHTINRNDEAQPLFRRALEIDEANFGPDHPNVAVRLNNIGAVMHATNRHAEAEPLFRRALAIDESNFGPNHPSVARDLKNLAELLRASNRHAEAEPLFRRALEIDEVNCGPNHPSVSIGLNYLAELLRITNRHAEAEQLYQRAIAIDTATVGADHPNVAMRLNNLALLYQADNRLREAEPLFRRALAIHEEAYGPNHSHSATSLNALANLLRVTKRADEAEPLFRRALEIDEANFGPDHPNVAVRLSNIGTLMYDTNRHAEAEPLFRRALAIDETSFGPNHPSVARDLSNLAELLRATNRQEEAQLLVRRALAIDEASFGPNHPSVAIRLRNLASLVRADEAERLYRRALAINEASFGPSHPSVRRELNSLASLYQRTNRHAEAEPLFRRVLAIDESSFGPNHPNVTSAVANLAGLYRAANRYAEAEPLYRRALAIDEASFGHDHPNVASCLNNLAALFTDTNRHVEAEPLYRRALTIMEVRYGAEHPGTRAVAKNLSGCVEQLGTQGQR